MDDNFGANDKDWMVYREIVSFLSLSLSFAIFL